MWIEAPAAPWGNGKWMKDASLLLFMIKEKSPQVKQKSTSYNSFEFSVCEEKRAKAASSTL